MRFHYRCLWWLLRGFFAVYFRLRIIGEDRVPISGPVLLASNHASFLDPPLIGVALRREASFLARESLFRVPLFGALIRSINALPVDRGGRSPKGLKSIVNLLAQGQAVALFPEGTRTRDGNLQPAQAGVGLAVVKSGAPVVPIRIHGSFESYSRRMWFPLPCRITVVFGDPIDFGGLLTDAKTAEKDKLRGIYRDVSSRIMEEIGQLDPSDAT